jgi:hypothetical protein
LVASGIVRRKKDGVRLLSKGELSTKVTFEIEGASKAAIAAVEKAGGEVVLPAPAVVEPPKKKAKSAGGAKDADASAKKEDSGE